MESIDINLTESSNTRSFEKDNLIHKIEFEKVQLWINERIEKLKKKEKSEQERLHDTITILGSRGSGKTTFLLSLLNYYKNDTKYISDVEVVDIIDPTLIEEKGHIFLTIISQIADKVETKLSKSDCNPECSDYHKKKDWEDKLKRLSSGIPSMDGVGGNMDSWQDAEFIMDKGLRSVKSAKNLEKDFHSLVELALQILKKKIFLITLDDIDIDFIKGLPVLETIRKYLTSPHIITLLSGDMKLFSKAIRKKQWKNFGKALLINEGQNLDRTKDYDDLVTEMEGQYLLKVMKPQRRIHLTTLLEKINLYGSNIEIKINNHQIIKEFYDNILSKFGIENQYQAEAYRSFLLNLPIRTQIQFLLEFDSSNDAEANVADPFLSDLYEKRVNIDMAKSTTKYLNAIILDLLIKEKVLDETYQLQPTTTDVSLNSSLISLSFLFSQRVKDNPYLIFDYFIRIGYVRNLLSVLDYQEEKNNNVISQLKPSIEGLCKHSAIFQDRGSRDIVCYITAYMRAFLNYIEEKDDNTKRTNKKQNLNNWGGTIPLPGFGFKSKQDTKSDSARIDSVFNSLSLFKQQIAYIPLSVSQPNSKQQSLPTYSIYVLLGAISELIRQYKDANENLDKGLSQLSQVRSYPMPNFINSTIGELEFENVFEPGTPTKDNDRNLTAMVVSWIKDYSEEKTITPHLLGKISTRFFYALRNIEDKDSSTNLGDAMHYRIIILLNSILLEDARENIAEVKLSNNNPNFNDDIFITNLKNIFKKDDGKRKNVDLNEEEKKEIFEKLHFSKWMLSCPLFLLYLNKEKLDPLLSFISYGKDENKLIDYSIYNELKKVEVLKKDRIKDIWFYYGSINIRKTATHLAFNKVSYDFFMKSDLDKIASEIQKIFINKSDITPENVEKAQTQIRNKNITW